jgi:ABC-2 type transport system ATP-binding protein
VSAGPTAPAANVIEAVGLGKRYRRRWALQDCTVGIPGGRVVGLVGANGAGKTTLMHLVVGLLRPTTGSVTVFGDATASSPAQLARVGFLAQDAPLYGTFSVDDHLRLGRALNPDWDDLAARGRIDELGFDLAQRAGQLSGGQRAQLALTVAVSKRPDLLLLDEPVAGLDPLARREFLQRLMETVDEHRLSVVLSSHLISDIEKVCDYLIVLAASRVRLTGDVKELLASHRILTAPRGDRLGLPADVEVIETDHTANETTLIVRSTSPITDPSWSVGDLTLEDLVLAYLSQAARAARTPRETDRDREEP